MDVVMGQRQVMFWIVGTRRALDRWEAALADWVGRAQGQDDPVLE